jgi:hypothetical protein
MSGSVRARLRWAANAAGPLLLLLTGLAGGGGLPLLFGFAVAAGVGEYAFGFLSGRRLTPYMAMIPAPLLLLQYSSIGEFRIRLACFFMLVYALTAARHRLRRPLPAPLARAGFWRSWALCFAVFALAAFVLYSRGIHLSGDEPHYVMIAQSLAEDHDFDLGNNLQNKTYLSFIPVKIDFHGTIRAGKHYSYHLPGLSFLLLPFYFLFKFLGGAVPGPLLFRLAAAAINAFFAAGLLLVLRTLWPGRNNGALSLFFLATFPLVFHAVHLYPELPAAALLLFAYLCSRPGRRMPFLAGWLLAAIPWLHFKYAAPLLILILWAAAGILRSQESAKAQAWSLARFLAPLAASASLLLLYSRTLYGSLNPAVISPEGNFFAIPIWKQVETFLSFFLDQRDGLLVYAPLFLLLLLAFRRDVRSQVRDFWLLAALLLSYVFAHAFTTVRGAYSPAGRPTAFVLWIMAAFLAAFYRQAGEAGRTLFRFLAGLTVFSTFWLFCFPLFLYQPVTREVGQRASSLLLFLGSRAVDLSALFPSFLKGPNGGYLPNWVWLLLLAAIALLYYSRAPLARFQRAAAAALPYAGLALVLLLSYFPHVQLVNRYQIGRLAFYNNSRNFLHWAEAKNFQVLAGSDYDLFIDLDGSAAERLSLRIVNPDRAAVKVTSGRRTLLAEGREAERRLSLPLRELGRFSLGRRRLAHLGLESKTGRGALRAGRFFWLEIGR